MPNILFIYLKTHQRQHARRGDIDNPDVNTDQVNLVRIGSYFVS